MKAILISDHAKWCALMMLGIKKIEVRKGTALYKATKKLIDEYGYAEFYVFCTRKKATRREDMFTKGCNIWFNKGYAMNRQYLMNGKVVFKFRCYKVEEIKFHCLTKTNAYGVQRIEATFTTQTLSFTGLKKLSCLTGDNLMKYLNDNDGYAIHISDLEIFDKPKELSEFRFVRPTKIKNFYYSGRLTNAPQNFCYVEVSK